MLLKFINYLRSKLPRDEVLGPWIEEIQTRGEMEVPESTGSTDESDENVSPEAG